MTEKQLIFEHKMVLKEDLYENTYVTPSANPVEFQRHWGISSLVNEDVESTLDVKGNYYENEHDQKFVLLSFTVPYHVTTNISQQFIHISHSLNYKLKVYGRLTYELDGREYLLKTFGASEFFNGDNALPYTIDIPGVTITTNELYTENQIGIPFNNESLGYFTYPELTYTYFIQLDNSIDNQTEETDDYVGLDIDFYTGIESTDYSIKLGFNQFYQSRDNYNIFSVKRLSLSYKREES